MLEYVLKNILMYQEKPALYNRVKLKILTQPGNGWDAHRNRKDAISMDAISTHLRDRRADIARQHHST